jgi:hypothetical protein
MRSVETEGHQQNGTLTVTEPPSPAATSASIHRAGPYVIRNSSAPASESSNGGSPDSTTVQFRPSITDSPSTAGPGQKPKRKRSMVACKNCNERRVRCDGATNGWVFCGHNYIDFVLRTL